ncbi:MAG: D-Ala-D-Ala carboxypeptidase family metallohydrolase [Asticcacaulis sp.]
MATITPENLKALAPKILPERATSYAPALDAALAAGDINTPLRIAHFMAQLAHESGGFRALVENLNYSAERLTQIFPSRVKTLADAQALVAAGKPAIAEAIYGNRPDLGNVNPGDGFKYIGRGFIMITGRANYSHFGDLISQPLTDHPELLEQPGAAALASAAYWKSRNINVAADRDDITTVTKLVNGGTVGLDARKALLATAKTIWAVVPAPIPAPPAAPPGTGLLSRYFSLEELSFSDSAVRFQIDNTPGPDIVANLTDTAKRLDQVQDLLGKPIQVNSGYRSPKLNTALHGAINSAHTTGHAVDFVCRGFGTPLQVCQAIIASGLKFDQLIQEGTWVHISFDPKMRQQVLTAVFGGGSTHYRAGL